MQPPFTSVTGAGGPLVRVACRLDAEGTETLVREIERLLRSGDHVVRLDLDAVTFISSAGIGALLEAHKKLRASGGRLEVVTASPQVLGVFRLTRLDTLIGPAAAPSAPPPATPPAAEREVGSVRLVAIAPSAGRPLTPRVVTLGGVPQGVALSQVSFALGLGTPDVDDPRPLDHAGEVVAAAGCLFHRPPAADPRIDWAVPHAGHPVRLVLAEGVAWDAGPAGSAGFESVRADGAVSLDDLARALLAACGTTAVAFVAIGEIRGLVGAELVRPLATATADDHPRAGNAAVAARWLSFSREPVHARRTALVVGVAASAVPAGALAPAVRPLDPAGDARLVGHVHAAVFAFRPVPREPGDLGQLVRSLVATPPVAVMHLLADPAPLVGSGTSEFGRGAAWFWPLATGEGGAA